MFKRVNFPIIFLSVIFVVISACSSPPTEEVTSEPPTLSESTENISKPEELVPTNTPIELPPTEIPTVAPTPISQEELIKKWRPAFGFYGFAYAACETALETAEASSSGEASGGESFAGILVSSLLVNTIDEALPEWDVDSSLEDHKGKIQGHVDELKNILSQWANDEITISEAADELAEICPSIEEDTLALSELAKEEGLSTDSLEQIAQDMQEAFEDFGEVEDETKSVESLPTDVGYSRSNPFPYGEVGSAPNWDIQILDTTRGEEAWNLIKAENSFNDPPHEGMEYILVMIKATSTHEENEEHSISSWDFKLTGSNLVAYDSASVLAPSPELDAEVFPGGEAEGWIVFEIRQEEDQLIIILDELSNWEDDRYRFYAAEEGAAMEVGKDLLTIQPTETGVERNNPAEYGEKIVTQNWEIMVIDIVRGDEAWVMIEEANSYNDPPESGMEYLLVKVLARFIGVSHLTEMIDNSSFKSTGNENVLYDYPSVVIPYPALDVSLFSGGEYEGWVVVTAAEGEEDLMVVFQPWSDWDDVNRRYLLLEDK